MPFSSIRPGVAGASTQEALTLTVATTGSNASTGTLTTQAAATARGAFATIDGALAALPKNLSHAVTINVGAGTYASTTVAGFSGAGSLTITGVLASPGLTGSMTGTATAATTTTITPTAPGWVASELLGSFVEITDVGPGTVDYRPITINTTGVVTFLAISTCNANDTFRILVPTTILTALTVSQNSCPITFNYFRIAGKTDTWNRGTTFNVCKMQACTSTNTNNMLTTYTNCIWAASSVPSFTDTAKIVFTNACLYVSNMTCTGVRRITGDVVALATTTTSALTLTRVDQAEIGFDAKNCTFTPLTLTDVGYYDCDNGIGLTGTNNTGTLGVQINGITNLQFDTAPTLVGTNALAYGSSANSSWTNLTSNYTYTIGNGRITRGSGLAANQPAFSSSSYVASTMTPTALNVGVSGASFSGVAASGAGTTISDATSVTNPGNFVYLTGGSAFSGVLARAGNAGLISYVHYVNYHTSPIYLYPSSGSVKFILNGQDLGNGNPILVYPGEIFLQTHYSTTIAHLFKETSPFTSDTYKAVTATGTVIGDALAATYAGHVDITGGAANTGVILPAPGNALNSWKQTYVNRTAGNINIYPFATGTIVIDALLDDAPYVLAAGKAIDVYPAGSGQYYTIALN